MSLLEGARAGRIAARFGRTVAIEWIQPREPDGGWIDYADFQPGDTQICLSVGRLIHDDDCVKVLAGSAIPTPHSFSARLRITKRLQMSVFYVMLRKCFS